MNDPTCVSLFSGIGGMDHGLARAGFRHIAFCESDAYRRQVLAARWPGVPIYDDVRDLRLAEGDSGGVGAIDLLCGGFPCQDLSVAGQRRGLAGDRSGLFHEYARIAESLRPRWLLVENVPGLLSSNGGRDFGTVIGTLADIGYGVAWRILDSRYFGVPQRRRRVFIIGALADGNSRDSAERAGEILAVGARCPRHPATRTEAREDATGPSDVGFALRRDPGGTGQGHNTSYVASLSGLGTGGPDDNDGQQGRLIAKMLSAKAGYRANGGDETLIAAPFSHGYNPNSNAAGRRREVDENLVATSITLASDPISAENLAQPSTKRNGDPGVVQVGASVRRLMPVECERLQALPDGWTDLGGTADSKRYAALGDAVTASVAEWIGRRLLDTQAEEG